MRSFRHTRFRDLTKRQKWGLGIAGFVLVGACGNIINGTGADDASPPSSAPATTSTVDQVAGGAASTPTMEVTTSQTAPASTPKPGPKPDPTPSPSADPKPTHSPSPTHTPAPKPTTHKPTPTAPATVSGDVHAGAFCSQHGWYGYTSKGTRMRCTTTATDSRYRWRAA